MVLVGVAGASAGWLLHPVLTPSSSPSKKNESAPPLAPDPGARLEASKPHEPLAGNEDRAQGRAAEGLISAALRQYALDEIRGGWAELRHDAIPDPLLQVGFSRFEEVVRRTPREIGRELAGRQTGADTLAGSDALAILRALDGGDLGPQLALVQDNARFPAFFSCSGGTVVDGVSAQRDLEHTLQGGVTFAFREGVYSLEELARGRRELPRCFTIAGAGIDSTLLVVDNWTATGQFERLELRDCTLRLGGPSMDLRAAAGLLRAERVRFVGFDVGAGSSSLFDAHHGVALYLSDCRIEGGYGRSPQHGQLFDVRSRALLARFERCTLSELHLGIGYWSPGSTVVFDSCSLTDLLDSSPPRTRAGIELRFENCAPQLLRPEDGPPQARDLNQLFPDWQSRLAR
jgi:hypothetical protein